MVEQDKDHPRSQARRLAEEYERMLRDAVAIEPGIGGSTVTAAAAKYFDNIASHIQSLNNSEVVELFAQSLALGRTISAEMRRRHLVEGKPEGNR